MATRPAVARQAAPAVVGVNFGDMSMYSGGAFIPDGIYILMLSVCMYQATDKNNQPKGPNNLSVLIDFYPFDNPVEEAKLQKAYSMGSKASDSFAPNPDTGKGIVAIPGAKGGNLNDKTNWAAFLKSLYDSGLPQGVFTNDVSVLDGAWVHVGNVDEDPERASFQSNTAEVAQAPRKPGKIAVVTEILEGGAPWDGGGGFEVKAAAPARVAPPTGRPTAVPAKAPAARPTAAPVAPVINVTAEPANDELRDQALNATCDVLIKNPNGMPRVSFRNETFKLASKKYSEDIAGQIINEFFEPGHEADLDSILADNGFKVSGPKVVPV